jgi:hypothetical protein
MELNKYPFLFEKLLFEVLRENNLKSLSDCEKKYNELQIEAIDKFRYKYFKNFNNNESIKKEEYSSYYVDESEISRINSQLLDLFDDIKNCTNDLKLLTANLYLFHPYINNPILEKKTFNGDVHSTYFQTFSDWNYSVYASCCFEKLYNFWDRIGDALALYLRLEIKPFSINFDSVINYLSKENNFNQNQNFIFLKSFKDEKYRHFNEYRKNIVHYKQYETMYKNHFLMNKNALEENWVFKNNLPEYFKAQLLLCIEGYKNTFELINNNL